MKYNSCTIAILKTETVQKKCELTRAHSVDVCPGGTLVELDCLQRRIKELLAEARELGLNCIEVSNRAIPMSRMIVEARESGKIGIFDSIGNAQVKMLESLVSAVGIDRLIFPGPVEATAS